MDPVRPNEYIVEEKPQRVEKTWVIGPNQLQDLREARGNEEI